MESGSGKVVKVWVTPYVKKYIDRTYGPTDKFYLTGSVRNDLRIALINLGITATIPARSSHAAGSYLLFDLGEDPRLHDAWEKNQPWLKVRAFYEYEFQLVLRKYIEAQSDLASRLRLSESEFSGKVALELFLEKYDIEEWEYSYESLRRQWNRIRQKDLSGIEAKVNVKFDFRTCCFPSDSTPDFVPARIWQGPRKRIVFRAWSRSRQALTDYVMYVPFRIAKESDELFYCQLTTKVINSYLAKGFTVK